MTHHQTKPCLTLVSNTQYPIFLINTGGGKLKSRQLREEKCPQVLLHKEEEMNSQKHQNHETL